MASECWMQEMFSDYDNTGEVLRYYRTCYAEKLDNGEYVGGIHWYVMRTYNDMGQVKSESHCFDSEKDLLAAYPSAKRIQDSCACGKAYRAAGFKHAKCRNRNKWRAK